MTWKILQSTFALLNLIYSFVGIAVKVKVNPSQEHHLSMKNLDLALYKWVDI